MTTRTPPRERDPEFDPVPGRGSDEGDSVLYYQRLVVNPLLGLFGFTVWFVIMVQVMQHSAAIGRWIFIPLILPVLLPRLIQVHCTDCGRTCWYHKRYDHRCHIIEERVRESDPLPTRWPTPERQILLWACAIMAIGTYALNFLF